MKPLPEENEPWVQDLKQHWPDAGDAPSISLPARKTPILFPALTAAAAAIVLLAVLIPVPEQPAPPPPAASVPTWPDFNPRIRASRTLSIPNLGRTRTATEPTTHRENLKRLHTRMNHLKTKQTWRTTP